jgi:calcineurin-like phosphoesterase family protein
VPALPEQVEYRFAGRSLVLADADAGIVLDWVPDALPEPPPSTPPSKDTGATGTKTLSFLRMPRKARSVRFAVLGDSGTGDANQRKVADMLWSYFEQDNRFKFALLLGDNLYASREAASDYRAAFLDPYKKFLDARVVFRATLGNHDLPAQADFPPFHMGGKERYSFTERNVKFVCLNSNKPTDPEQLHWLDDEFGNADGWRICFFHHPLYSSGEHASESRKIRAALEDALVRNHVNVVFSGHEHFYERATPQKNVQYFVSGAAAKLRRGDLAGASFTAFGWDREHSVMLVEIDGDTMYFQALGESGRTIDCGVLYRAPEGEQKGAKDDSTRAWLGACDDARAWAYREGNRQTASTTPP